MWFAPQIGPKGWFALYLPPKTRFRGHLIGLDPIILDCHIIIVNIVELLLDMKHKSGGRISSPSFVPTKPGDEILSPLLWNLKEIDGNVEFLTRNVVSGHSSNFLLDRIWWKLLETSSFFGGRLSLVAPTNFLLVAKLKKHVLEWKNERIKL